MACILAGGDRGAARKENLETRLAELSCWQMATRNDMALNHRMNPGRVEASCNNSGVIVRYTWVAASLTCPR